jgi:PKD repeat protein
VIAVTPDFASLDPIASFTVTMPLYAGESLQFFDTSSNDPTIWYWEFGDGLGDSTQENPSYNYANPGTYTVTLTVESDCGIDSIQNSITVVESNPSDLYLPFARKD